jgi:hypothetical protein
MIDIKKIALRAINSSKRTSPSTYVALRLLLDNQHNLKWLQSYCERKLTTISKWSYFEYQWFKKIDEEDNLNHRTFYIGSPTTLLVEAYILSILSKEEIFKNNSQNFSYYLAEDYASYNYSYYYKGYCNRNISISNKLAEDTNLRAFVFDLSNYYPSMDKSFVYEKFSKYIEQTNIDEKIKNGILAFIKSSLDVTVSGIPVNPDIGHLLGSITLKSFDNEMYEIFGDKYFRYVDDIVIIENQDNVEYVKAILDEKIPKSKGAILNQEKYQELNSLEWELLTIEIGHNDEFINLLNDIQLYLSMQDTASEIQKQLKENKISLPVYKLYINSRYGGWQSFVKWLSYYNPLKSYRKSLTIEKLVNRAIKLKNFYIKSLKSLDKVDTSEQNVNQKVLTKKYHFYINRLIYLFDVSEFEKNLLPLIPKTKDFFETKSVIEALIKNDVSNILNIGGKSILTFAEISKANSLSLPKINKTLLKADDNTQLYSLGVLSLYGLILLNKSIEIEQIQNNQIKNFLQFCNVQAPTERLLNDFSYNDEILSLRLNTSHENILKKLFSKYDSKEKLYLAGLTLDEKDYFSL